MKKMEQGVSGKLHNLEETINKLSEAILSKDIPKNNNRHLEEHDKDRPIFSSKMAKMDFPKYFGDDPTEWLNRVSQFFDFQVVSEDRKVAAATFHLEGEANQWLHRTYKDEDRMVTWKIFEDEIWALFGPPEYEDFDEALSRVRQDGSLRDYQKEFKRLGNRVHGWTEKAQVGTFMGGLKSGISEGIHMFKPKTLKEVIGLARIKDEQVCRGKSVAQPLSLNHVNATAKNRWPPPVTPKRLSWEEMQIRRAQGLCFNCNEKFTPGYNCQEPLLEGPDNNRINLDLEDKDPIGEGVLIGLE